MFKLKQQELKVFQKDFQMKQANKCNELTKEKDKPPIPAGLMIGLDKVVMFFALVIYRIGWWSTIFCQQILLGMLTIFGPIQWAFSVLPKWEGAWAKWITRYLTVHFYGAMLYFVGFYVLLLFDIVLSVQVENLTAITQGEGAMAAYIQNAFMTCGYLLAASVVALKCLNLVPDGSVDDTRGRHRILHPKLRRGSSILCEGKCGFSDENIKNR